MISLAAADMTSSVCRAAERRPTAFAETFPTKNYDRTTMAALTSNSPALGCAMKPQRGGPMGSKWLAPTVARRLCTKILASSAHRAKRP